MKILKMKNSNAIFNYCSCMLTALLLAGCGPSIKTQSDFDPEMDCRSYKTFVWVSGAGSIGAAGSFAVMAGAAAVDAAMEPAPLILALVLFLWTPPHFWALAYACKKDYQNAEIPMLPVLVDDRTATLTILINAVVLSLLSLVPVFYGLGWIYLLGAASGGAYFVQASLRLARKPGIQLAWRTFGASIVQLGLLLTAAIIDRLILG